MKRNKTGFVFILLACVLTGAATYGVLEYNDRRQVTYNELPILKEQFIANELVVRHKKVQTPKIQKLSLPRQTITETIHSEIEGEKVRVELL